MFLVRKYTEQANYFKEEELRKILEEFINLDEQSKGYVLDLDIPYDSEIVVTKDIMGVSRI